MIFFKIMKTFFLFFPILQNQFKAELFFNEIGNTTHCTKLRIWSHLLKKSLMEIFIYCAVTPANFVQNYERDRLNALM